MADRAAVHMDEVRARIFADAPRLAGGSGLVHLSDRARFQAQVAALPTMCSEFLATPEDRERSMALVLGER